MLAKYFTFLFILLPASSYAYIDPGTGSLIVQGIIAGLAMFLMTIKVYWQKLTVFFNTIFKKKKPEPDEENKEP